MARKTVTYIVPASPDNRDSGRKFLITEMSADRAERWATRALMALAKAGVDIGEGTGMAAIAVNGFRALGHVDPDQLEPLLGEMMGCVQYVPELPGALPQAIMGGDNSQIEEVSTRFALRMEVFKLHTGFSLAG